MADLTDDQIDRLYRRPAVARAERMERELKGETAGPASPASLDSLRPDRETFVAAMLGEFGGDRPKWDEAYDRLKESWANASQ